MQVAAYYRRGRPDSLDGSALRQEIGDRRARTPQGAMLVVKRKVDTGDFRVAFIYALRSPYRPSHVTSDYGFDPLLLTGRDSSRPIPRGLPAEPQISYLQGMCVGELHSIFNYITKAP